MGWKLFEHLLSIIFVTVVLVGGVLLFNVNSRRDIQKSEDIAKNYTPDFVDLNNSFEKALLKDVLSIFDPEDIYKNSNLIDEIVAKKNTQFLENINNSGKLRILTRKTVFKILLMYLKFLFVYLVVMAVTYYAVLTAGTWRFIRKQIKKEKKLEGKNDNNLMIIILGKIIKTVIHMILFSPAFVIAYSIKTELNTDSILFMILLGVISNGLLIIYTNKFYAFLVSESRKGYVDTAIVKNMNSSYMFNTIGGIEMKLIFKPVKNFGGHVFDHIFKNAVVQYSSTLKEQAAFLITGLIIIEMALNIHGYLNYEMLKQILYGNSPLVIFIILLLFYTAKATEIVADMIHHVHKQKYRNK